MNALVIVLIAVALAAVGYLAWQAEQKRREQFRVWAAERGWSYDHRNNATLRHRYAFLDRLKIGHSRRASHHLKGEWQGYPATAFCFRYTTGSGKHQQTHFLGVALVSLERPFRELRVYPENMLSRFGQFLGYDDIDFESIEFSKAFTVRSADKKFAYDFCNTDMMNLLLSAPTTALELEDHTLALFVGRYLNTSDLAPMFDHLLKIRSCMPEYLFRT